MERITIIGAGNGGKAAAADLALQGKRIRLFEFPQYRANVDEVLQSRRLLATGAIRGEAVLELVTCDLAEAVRDADMIMVCTQALAHERVARELSGLVQSHQVILLNPGSTGGSLVFAHVFRQVGMKKLPILAETSTLTYGCRASGLTVDVKLKVKRVVYGVLPGAETNKIGPVFEGLYSGLVSGASVLEAGLNNGNPVLHPPIAIMNAARIEREGEKMLFYKDGVSRTVARVIQKLDEERMALLRALGYPAQSEPTTSVQQGYAASHDYYECYTQGAGYCAFPSPNTLDHRYFHEDIGIGLVMFCSLGRLLGVPTPACEAVVSMGAVITGVDYLAEGKRTLKSLGLGALSVEELKSYLHTGQLAH